MTSTLVALPCDCRIKEFGHVPREGAPAIAPRVSQAIAKLDLSFSNLPSDKVLAETEKAIKEGTSYISIRYVDLSSAASALAKMLCHSAVHTLNLEGSSLEDPDGVALAELLSINPILTSLNLRKNRLGSETVCALLEALPTNDSLQALDLSENDFSDLDNALDQLMTAAQTHRTLRNLILENLNCAYSLIVVAETISTMALVCLSLGKNSAWGAEKQNCEAFRSALGNNRTLQHLNMGSVSNSMAAAIFSAMTNNDTLKELHVAFSEGTENMSSYRNLESIAKNRSLDLLDLSGCQIGMPGMRLLAAVLQASGRLKKIDLCTNALNPECGEELAKGVSGDPVLRVLFLSDNSLSCRGTIPLARAVAQHGALQVLFLNGNGIGADGAKAIAAMLNTNNSVRFLHLNDNAIGPEGGAALAEVCSERHRLFELCLNNNGMGSRVGQLFAEVLKVNAILYRLGLANNGFEKEAGDQLYEAMAKNRTVLNLELRNVCRENCNQIPDDILGSIEAHVKRNQHAIQTRTSQF